MGAYRLAEYTVRLVEQQIKSNIAAALAAVRTQRNDPVVSTEPPYEYFQYEFAQVYRAPAVFTIIKSQDIDDSVKNPNHINAPSDVVVAVVVEDRVESRVVKKAWRYQAALMACLHQVTLTSSDNAVRLFCRVKTCEFSGNINLKDENQSSESVFRKEVSLRLNVDHIENLE